MNVGSLQLVLSCVLLGATLVRAGDNPAPSLRTILFFGDSLTAGYGLADPAGEAYPSVLQQKIDEAGLRWHVVNAGLSGDTTAGGVRRVDWVLRQHVDIFVLALGANDGLRGIDPTVTRANLEQILARVHAKQPDAQLVIAGMQMPPEMGATFTREFRDIFPAVAEKYHARLIPFLLEGVGAQPDLNQPDRIHPNAAGHAVIAEHVWKIIRPLL